MANCRRLFISGIPVEASEDEIKKRFEIFGDVSSVQKVIRSQEGFPTKCFAYLDITLSDASYHKCLSLYRKAKWKGNQLVIQPAKENFLNRLEAERQQKHLESSDDGAMKKPDISYDNSTELHIKSKDGKRLIKVNGMKNSKKIKRFSSQSIMENHGSISDLTWDLTPTTTPSDVDMTTSSLPAKKKDKDRAAKRNRSNKQRLEALEKSKDYKKPSIVEGTKVNSHIVFESEDKVEEHTMPDITKPPTKTPLLPLFDSSDSEDDSDVEVTKPKFEGKEGAKLFKLQQKIGWDKRFEIDKRFLDESSTSDGDTSSEQDDDNESVTSDEELKKEQQRNRDLIEEMFGDTSSIIIPSRQVMPEVQRYDPSAIGSEAFEKQPPLAKKKNKKVTLNEDVKAPSPLTTVSPEVHTPKVSKECFYSVSDSLKDTLKASEGSHVFNFTTSTPKDKNITTIASVASTKTPNWLLNLQNDGDDNESDETASTTEFPSVDGHKRTLFFFHTNSSELRNRLDCPDTKFHRTCSLEELEAKWPQTRAQLKEQYKRRHRDALRWLRQRKQIK